MEVVRQYDYDKKIESHLSNLKEEASLGDKSVRCLNAKLLLEFYQNLIRRESKTNGLARRVTILSRGRALYRYFDKPFNELTEDLLLDGISRIETVTKNNGESRSVLTSNTDKKVLKKILNWIHYKDKGEYTEQVRRHGQSPMSKCISTRLTNHERQSILKTTDDILTEEEFKRLLNTASSIRDKAIIGFLYETGCRVGELCATKLKDISFSPLNKYEITVTLRGKSGIRMNNLLFQTRWILPYLNSHPNKSNRNSELFVNKDGTPMKPSAVGRRISWVAHQAGITKLDSKGKSKYKYLSGKKVTPHTFRHTSVSKKIADGWTEGMVKAWHGWSNDSTMLNTYLHLRNDDVMKYNRVRHMEEEKAIPEYNPCNCKAMNHKDELTCWGCNVALENNQYVDTSKVDLMMDKMRVMKERMMASATAGKLGEVSHFDDVGIAIEVVKLLKSY